MTIDRIKAAVGPLALGLLAALALSGCGSGDDPPPAAGIGPAGGNVAAAGGAQVVVPPGALAAPAAIAVAPIAAPTTAPPSTLLRVGPVVAFTPHGQRFAAPVTITLPFEPALVPAGSVPRLYKTANGAAGPWEEVAGATVSGNAISGQVTGFSEAAVFVFGNAPPTITQQPAAASVVAPASASFTVAFSGTPGFEVQWQRSDDGGANWSNVGAEQAVATAPGSSTFTTAATRAQPAAAGGDDGALYRAEIRNVATGLGQPVRSTAAMLSVTAPPPGLVALGITVAGPGRVQSAPASIDCTAAAGTCSASFAAGTVVVLTATPDGGAAFSGWSGDADCSDGSLTLTAARSCTATFVAAPPAPASDIVIVAGADFSLARVANFSGFNPLRAWGSDAAGTLGTGAGDQTRNAPAGGVLASNVRALGAGSAHALAVRGTGEVQAWGYNGFGQLGDGGNLSRESPVFVGWDEGGSFITSINAVAACGGSLHSLILRASGEVRAMGANAQGQLGDGSNTDRARGVPVSGIGSASAIACGGRHSLALLADGTLRAWGDNAFGQLGVAGGNRNLPVAVPGLTGVIAIAAGANHSLALRSDGSVWSWGDNSNGQLAFIGSGGAGPTMTGMTAGITRVAAGGDNSAALRSDGAVFVAGINEVGQLGIGGTSPGFAAGWRQTLVTNAVAIAVGSAVATNHLLALRSDGSVLAWGWNISGQLGLGHATPIVATPTVVPGLNLN